MKKKIITISILLSIVLIFVFDYVLVKTTNSNPLLAIRRSDSFNYVYTTPFYRVWKCYNGTTHIGSISEPFNCPKIVSDFVIVDETEACAEMLELFYSDDYYDYYFPCLQSSTVFIKFTNGKKITVKDALANKMVTIEELKSAGLIFYQYSRFEIDIDVSNKCSTKRLLSPIYSHYEVPITYNLFSYCLDEANVFINNNRYDLANSLSSGKITLDQITKKLEYDSIYYNVKKLVVYDGGSILYSTDDYALLKCNTIAGNKDIYIGPKDMKFDNKFCK